MASYFVYWKRGWWVLILIIALNIFLGMAYAGLAFLLRPMMPNPFPIAVATAWLLVGAPLAGWLFEKFARGSDRIV